MVEQALKHENIRNVRIDGNVSQLGRERALEQLRNDENVKVILMTVSCGGVG